MVEKAQLKKNKDDPGNVETLQKHEKNWYAIFSL